MTTDDRPTEPLHWKNHAPPNATHLRLPNKEISTTEQLESFQVFKIQRGNFKRNQHVLMSLPFPRRKQLCSQRQNGHCRSFSLVQFSQYRSYRKVAPQIQGRAARPKAVVYVLEDPPRLAPALTSPLRLLQRHQTIMSPIPQRNVSCGHHVPSWQPPRLQ